MAAVITTPLYLSFNTLAQFPIQGIVENPCNILFLGDQLTPNDDPKKPVHISEVVRYIAMSIKASPRCKGITLQLMPLNHVLTPTTLRWCLENKISIQETTPDEQRVPYPGEVVIFVRYSAAELNLKPHRDYWCFDVNPFSHDATTPRSVINYTIICAPEEMHIGPFDSCIESKLSRDIAVPARHIWEQCACAISFCEFSKLYDEMCVHNYDFENTHDLTEHTKGMCCTALVFDFKVTPEGLFRIDIPKPITDAADMSLGFSQGFHEKLINMTRATSHQLCPPMVPIMQKFEKNVLKQQKRRSALKFVDIKLLCERCKATLFIMIRELFPEAVRAGRLIGICESNMSIMKAVNVDTFMALDSVILKLYL